MTADPGELVALRRRFHRHAELPFLEVYTAATVLEALEPLGGVLRTGRDAMHPEAVADYPDQDQRQEAVARAVAAGADPATAQRLGESGTAVVAEFTGDRPGPTWAIRFDMDALPIIESTEGRHLPAAQGFRCDAGTMHACGHDGHTAIGVQLARWLSAGDFPGKVRLLFQPAEEGARGAAAMIPAGVLDGVDRFLGLHLGNSLPTGTMVGTAVDLQATIKYEATFRGVAAHAAGGPQHGRNALAAAASATIHLLGLSRSSDGITNVNVGTLHAGSATNIIPDLAQLTGEVRSDVEAVCADLYRGVQRVLGAAADMYGTQVESRVTAQSTTLDSDSVLVDEVLAVARTIAGDRPVLRTAPLSASDDASLLAAHVQAAGGLSSYLLVGSGNPAPHHNPLFDIDESSLPLAVDWLQAIVQGGGTPDRSEAR